VAPGPHKLQGKPQHFQASAADQLRQQGDHHATDGPELSYHVSSAFAAIQIVPLKSQPASPRVPQNCQVVSALARTEWLIYGFGGVNGSFSRSA